MVCARALRYESQESNDQRPSDAFSLSSHSGSRNPLEGDFGVSLRLSAKGGLAKITPFTVDAIVRRQAAITEVPEETTHGKSSALKNEGAMTVKICNNLDFHSSKAI